MPDHIDHPLRCHEFLGAPPTRHPTPEGEEQDAHRCSRRPNESSVPEIAKPIRTQPRHRWDDTGPETRPHRRWPQLCSWLIACLISGLVVTRGAAQENSIPCFEATISFPDGYRSQAIRYVDAYPAARARVRQLIGGFPAPNLKIRLVPTIDDLQAAVKTAVGVDLPEWVAGVALPSRHEIVIRLDLHATGPFKVHGLLAHEVCHIALHHRLGEFDRELPRWLDEGLAQVAEGKPYVPDPANLPVRAFLGRLLPLSDLEAAFPASEGASTLAYTQAESFVRFLTRQDSDAMPELLELLASGAPLADAANLVFGRSLSDLEREWVDELEADRSWIPGLLGSFAIAGFLLAAVVLGASRIVRRRKDLEARWAAEARENPEGEDFPDPPGALPRRGAPLRGPRPRRVLRLPIRRQRPNDPPPRT